MLPGVFLAGVFSTLAAAPFALPATVTMVELGLLAYLGFVQLGLGLVLFTIGTRSVPAAQSVLIGLLEVVLGSLWVWLAFDEKPAPTVLIGGSIVICSVAFNAFFAILRRQKSPRLPRAA
jgi:drug/metabolite transporter (DMT)-like permease